MTARQKVLSGLVAPVALVLLIVAGCTKVQRHNDECVSLGLAAAAKPRPAPALARKAPSLEKKPAPPAAPAPPVNRAPARTHNAVPAPHGPVPQKPTPAPTKSKAKKPHHHHGHHDSDFCDD